MAGTLEQYEILGETSKIPGWAAQAKDKGRFPPGAGTFKIYYKDLCKAAGVDENGIFGEDAPADKMKVTNLLRPNGDPTPAVGYDIKMVGTELDKVKRQLTKKGGGIHKQPGKPDMFYHFAGSSSKPQIKLDFETGSSKYRITLTKTGITKRTIEGRQSGPKPSTAQQEKCTLKIIELVLGANTAWMNPDPGTLEGRIELFNNKIIPDLHNIWKGIAIISGRPGTPTYDVKPTPGRSDWYWHFLAQFIDCIEAHAGGNKILIPNNQYDFFDYDDFMELITTIIEKEGPPDVNGKSWEQNPDLPPYFYNAPNTRWPGGPQGQPQPIAEGTWPFYGKIGKKDTWNPADIWLVKKSAGYDTLKEAVGSKFKISEVNTLLKKAYRDGTILGISLKKSNATMTRMGTTHWSFHNLSFDPREKRATGLRDPLQKITPGDWKMNFPFSKSSKKFTGSSYEWTLIAQPDAKLGFSRKVDKFRMGSSTTGEQQTQNYEMAPGGGAAQYGKVPLNILKEYFKNQKVVTSSNRPTGGANPTTTWLASASPATSGHLIPEKDFVKKLIPKNKNDDNYKNWTKIVNKIKKSTTINFTPTIEIDDVVDNLIETGPGITKENNLVMQELLFANLMLDFAAAKTFKGEPVALQKVIKDMYYMSQKIGKVGTVQFGPFHKWA